MEDKEILVPLHCAQSNIDLRDIDQLPDERMAAPNLLSPQADKKTSLSQTRDASNQQSVPWDTFLSLQTHPNIPAAKKDPFEEENLDPSRRPINRKMLHVRKHSRRMPTESLDCK